jgi:uncharacterized protein (TIGR02246 family)
MANLRLGPPESAANTYSAAVRLAWLVLLVACSAAAPTVKTFAPSDRTAVQAVLDAQMAAWNRGDLAGYMAGYAKTEDLTFTSGGKVRKGWQTTFDHFHKRYATDPKAMGKLAFDVLAIDPLGADGAVVLGTWVLTESPSDGKGVFSVVLARRPEGWRIVHDHTSVTAP